jgi:hypothetical protein
MRNSIPFFERLIRVLKDCAGQVREAISVNCAELALPMAGRQRIDIGVTATGADDALRPAANNEVLNAIRLSLEQRVELRCGQTSRLSVCSAECADWAQDAR